MLEPELTDIAKHIISAVLSAPPIRDYVNRLLMGMQRVARLVPNGDVSAWLGAQI